jgi:hypothetical protein
MGAMALAGLHPAVAPRRRTEVRRRACVTADIVAGVVEANMGGGGIIGAPAWQHATINELTDPDNRDPLPGFPVFKALLCDVVGCSKHERY